jgi:hypothetical protein
MRVHNPLSVQHFHGVLAKNAHACSLKLRSGEVSIAFDAYEGLEVFCGEAS